MFGPGYWELLVVLMVMLLLFGRLLPSVARSVGRSLSSFKEGLRGVDLRADIQDVSQGQDSAQARRAAVPHRRLNSCGPPCA